MPSFSVKIGLDGKVVEIPVDDVESLDEAKAAVQYAIDNNELDMSVFEEEKPGPLAGYGPVSTFGRVGLSVASGIANGLRSVDEWALMARDAVLPEGPEAVATRETLANLKIENARKRDQEKAALRAAFGSQTDFNPLGEMLGEGILFAPVGGGVGSTFTRTVMSNLLGGAFTGSITAADRAVAMDETWKEATLGGLLGLGVSLFHIPRGIEAFGGRQLAKEFKRPYAQEALAVESRIQRMTGEEAFSFTSAQVATDNPWLTGMEIGARSREFIAKQKRNTETLVNFLLKRGRHLQPEDFMESLGNALTGAVQSTRSAAGEVYRAGLDNLVTKYGDDLVIDGVGYLHKLDDVIARLGDVRRLGTRSTQELIEHRNWLRTKVEPFVTTPGKGGKTGILDRRTGTIVAEYGPEEASELVRQLNLTEGTKLTVDDTINVLQGHNQLLEGLSTLASDATPGSNVAVGKELKQSMMGSLDPSNSTTNAAAADDIRNLQAAYKTEMETVRLMERSAVARIFGATDEQALRMMETPEVALERLARMEPSGFRRAVSLLREVDGGDMLIEDMKQQVLARAVAKANVPRPSAMGDTDINKLLKNLSAKGGDDVTDLSGRYGEGLFEPWEQAEIIDTAKALKQMKVLYLSDIAKDVRGEVADAGINLVSLHPGFVTRYLVRRMLGSNRLEHILIDPKARQALLLLGEQGPGTLSGKLAVAYLATSLGYIEEAYRVANQQEKQRYSTEALSRRQ